MTDLSLIADLVRAGIDPDLVGRVVNALMDAARNSTGIPVDTTAEKRRAYDRERKAQKKNSTGNSTGIPPEQEIALTSLSASLNSIEGKKERKEEAKRPRATGIPPDWKPSEDHYAEGATFGQSRNQVDAKAEEMRLWARANGHRAVARKLDWDATFSGWMRRDGAKNVGRTTPDRSVSAGLGRLAEKLRDFDAPFVANQSGGRS